jgi:hypothetical protein
MADTLARAVSRRRQGRAPGRAGQPLDRTRSGTGLLAAGRQPGSAGLRLLLAGTRVVQDVPPGGNARSAAQ